MITIIATALGFLGSIVPEIVKSWRDIKLDTKSLNKQEIDKRSDIIEVSSIVADKSGVSWVDAFNGTVRPALAYSFFLLYSSTKVVKFFSINSDIPIIEYIGTLWTSDDQAIFASIISFYFGQRTFSKLNRFYG